MPVKNDRNFLKYTIVTMCHCFICTSVVAMVPNLVIVVMFSVFMFKFFPNCGRFPAIPVVHFLMVSFSSFQSLLTSFYAPLSICKPVSCNLHLCLYHAYFRYYQMSVLQALNTHRECDHQLILWIILCKYF